MKKLLVLITLIFSVVNIITFPQSTTFIRTFSQGVGCNVLQTNDGGYLVGSYDALAPGKIIFSKTDSLGNLIREKNYDFKRAGYAFLKIIQHSEEGYVFTATKMVNDKSNICLVHINTDGDTIWTRTYLSQDNEYGYSLSNNYEGGYIISGINISGDLSQYKLIVINTDSDGSVLWSNIYFLPFFSSSPLNTIDILKTNDNNYIVLASNKLFKLKANGDSLWVKNLNKTCNYIFQTKDSGFVLCGNGFIMKTNASGNLEWNKNYTGQLFNSVVQQNDGTFILTGPGLIKTDSNGNKLSEIIYPNNFYSSLQSRDGYVLTGSINSKWGYYIGLMKIDEYGNAKGIALTSFNESQIYSINEEYEVTWFSSSITNVNIELTTNGGDNWITVASNIPDSGKYKFRMSGSQSEKCKIKISEANDPNLYDISNNFFTLLNNSPNDFIAINQIKMWIGNNGMGSHNPETDRQGFYWPGGTDAKIGAVFYDGLIWGGKINGSIKVNGNTHRNGLQPGKILSQGLPDTTTKIVYNIWKIRKDWETLPESSERAVLEYNYSNWPGELGAPFEDTNHDGQFTKGIDKPKFYGDETLWFVANDLDSVVTHRTYGSDPIGLEFQVTTYGFNEQNELADVVFKKYKIINKSSDVIDDMYIGYWSDPDLGFAVDDYAGCDSTLNLGFCYNGDNNDESDNYSLGYGENPPAIGYLLLQGPIVPGDISDKVKLSDGYKNGYKDLKMTSFFFYKCGGTELFRCPDQGNYNGTIQFYNNLKGLIWNGDSIINPNTNVVTKYCVNGDPVTKTGWYEGAGWQGGYPKGDRYFLMSSGPFNFARNDTQEVVYAIVMARGTDNINSVKVLKDKAKAITNFYNLGILNEVTNRDVLPKEFKLFQNYPNPFNPSTTISYQLSVNSKVTLKLFDVLGKEVAILVNENQNQGIHHYTLSIIYYKLPSGVYFYQLKASDFTQTKKMVILK